MEIITLATMGGLVFAAIWVLYVLLQTILYGALTCATGFSGVYIGSCVESADMFQIGDIGITSAGIVAFLLMFAAFHFISRFFKELSAALPRILNPLKG